MSTQRELAANVAEDLTPLGPVQTRGWFGAVALRLDGLQFAFVAGDHLYFRVDEQSRLDYEQAGRRPFEYTTNDGRRVAMRSYYAVPAAVIGNPNRLYQWAQTAHAAAVANAKTKLSSRPARSPDF
jgi:DNA transformation protein